MKRSAILFWLFVFIAINAIQGFGQTSEIAGSWQAGSVSMLLQYQNQVTGQTRSGRSHLFQYKFLPNGSYTFIGLMEINIYNCTSTYYNEVTGKYTVDGNAIELNPGRDYWKSMNSCAASATKEVTKAPTPKTIHFERKTDDHGRQLLCIADGEAEECYERAKP